MSHSLRPLTPVDTRHLFEPLHAELMQLLLDLTPRDWMLPTVAGSWTVRDVVAHLIDGQMRRLSVQRDGHPLPPPRAPVDGYDSLVAYLNELNAEWVGAMRRVSPLQLLRFIDATGREYAEFVSRLDPDGRAAFPVAWAGESESRNWMDIGRDYTELWHHQAQIRLAVGADPLDSKDWMLPVLDLSLRAIHRSWGGVDGRPGAALLIEVEGEFSAAWTILGEDGMWVLYRGAHPDPTARVALSGDTAWRLLFNALDPSRAEEEISATGDPTLTSRFFGVRGVMV